MVHVGTCGHVDMVIQNTNQMKEIHPVELG